MYQNWQFYKNLFFSIIRNPKFNVDEISFRSASDVDKFVADQRLATQFLNEASGRADVPFPIIDRILHFIDCDPELQDEPINFQVPLTNIVIGCREEIFRTLTLVQRSWTGPTRKYLSRRIIARSPSDVVRLLRGPIPGSHTRELIFLAGEVWGSSLRTQTEAGFYLRPGDVEVDLVNLIERMPLLSTLTIREKPSTLN